MMDYYGFWQGFLLLFGLLPSGLGAGVGLIWAWKRGRRGIRLIPPALLCGFGTGLTTFVVAVLLFRA